MEMEREMRAIFASTIPPMTRTEMALAKMLTAIQDFRTLGRKTRMEKESAINLRQFPEGDGKRDACDDFRFIRKRICRLLEFLTGRD